MLVESKGKDADERFAVQIDGHSFSWGVKIDEDKEKKEEEKKEKKSILSRFTRKGDKKKEEAGLGIDKKSDKDGLNDIDNDGL